MNNRKINIYELPVDDLYGVLTQVAAYTNKKYEPIDLEQELDTVSKTFMIEYLNKYVYTDYSLLGIKTALEDTQVSSLKEEMINLSKTTWDKCRHLIFKVYNVLPYSFLSVYTIADKGSYRKFEGSINRYIDTMGFAKKDLLEAKEEFVNGTMNPEYAKHYTTEDLDYSIGFYAEQIKTATEILQAGKKRAVLLNILE